MSEYKPYDSAGNKYGELRPAPQPTGVPFDMVAKALSSAEGSGSEADTKPSGTLEENIAGILLELTGSTPSGNFAVSLAYKRILSLYQKELVRLKEQINASSAMHPLYTYLNQEDAVNAARNTVIGLIDHRIKSLTGEQP